MSCDCSTSDGCTPLPRRQFLRIAGAGALAVSSAGGPLSILAGPFSRAAEGGHLVPADKKLSAQWTASLYARGEPEVHRGKALETIGMPVGGVAAGQLYLRGDGTLGSWQIFNRHHFSGYGATNYRYRTPDSPVEQGFAVRARSAEGTRIRRLRREDFQKIEFDGRYPIGRVRYASDDFPVKVEMEAFSPFIPLDTHNSTLPATLFRITVENVSREGVRASVLGWLENAVCFHSARKVTGLRHSKVLSEEGRALLVTTASAPPESENQPAPRPAVVLADFEGGTYGDWKAEGKAFGDKPAPGTLPQQQKVTGFLGKGLVNTYLGGDAPHGSLTSPAFEISRRFVNFLIGGGSHEGSTALELVVDSEVVRTASGEDKEELAWRSWNVSELEGKHATIRIVDRHSGGWGHINVDQIELGDTPRGEGPGPVEELEDYGSMALAMAGESAGSEDAGSLLESVGDLQSRVEKRPDASYPLSERRASALLTREVLLEPGTRHEFDFVLAWHFPNHKNGRAYARQFPSAPAVARHVLDNQTRLREETKSWWTAYYESTLPHWLLFRLKSTVANLATGTCQWWGNGRFWGWEGVGCCHGTCTHVWNYAHALARLFPDLERSVREMQDLSAALHPDGLVGFRGERNGHYAADGQAGTVLKCYREHQMAPDDSFLQRNWSSIKRVLEYSIARDRNADGLMEDSQHNTFDINFEGPNTFVGSLYLAALRAGEEMAREAGDAEFSERARKIFEAGVRLSVERLWDGEYFIQEVDLAKHPRFQYGRGCLSDQVFGQGWAHQLGLGRIYPEDLTRQALRSVWKYNWAPDVKAYNDVHKPERWFVSPGEAGLFTCTWPRSEHLREGVRYRSEVWTGIEYQVAGHMIWEGLLEEGLAVVRAVHDRYHPLKHNPFNEIECGDHYARALASWGVFLALCGYEHHGPKGHLGFAPRIEPQDFRAAFTTAEGWGTFEQRRTASAQTEHVRVRWGKVRLKTLAFELAPGARPERVTVRTAGREIPARHTVTDTRLLVELREETTVPRDGALEVVIDT